jgi:flagellar hook assembly protein FlgD
VPKYKPTQRLLTGRSTRRLEGKDSNEERPPNGAYQIAQTESKTHRLRFTGRQNALDHQSTKSKLSLGRSTRRLEGKDSNEERPPNGAYQIAQTESKTHRLRFTGRQNALDHQSTKSKLSLGRSTRRLEGKDSNEERPPNGAYQIAQTESKTHRLRFTHGSEKKMMGRQRRNKRNEASKCPSDKKPIDTITDTQRHWNTQWDKTLVNKHAIK